MKASGVCSKCGADNNHFLTKESIKLLKENGYKEYFNFVSCWYCKNAVQLYCKIK